MKSAQESFDECMMPLCPEHLTSPRLHSIMNNPDIKSYSIAVKGVGSQGKH